MEEQKHFDLNLETFKELVDNIYDEIFIWDDNYTIIYANKACYRHYGLYPHEIIGHTLDHFMDREKYWEPSSLPYIYKEKKPVIQRQKSFLGIDMDTITIPILDEHHNVKYVVQSVRDAKESLYKVLAPLQGIAVQEAPHSDKLIYKSDEMHAVVDHVSKIAGIKAPLLILGETGTGKNVIARYVHDLSPRREKPFVSINMASINPTVIESELFGYKKGAFTGACPTGKKGLFEIANGGTLFLDEISELSYELQAKLLHVIQEEEILPMGGVCPVKLDVRVLSASNCDLAKLVEAGKFRQDLYHRLNVFEVTVPALRARKPDIPLLASHFLNIFNKKYEKCTGFSEKTMDAFLSYSWDGNVRELSNIVERSVITAEDNRINVTDLPESFFRLQDSPSGDFFHYEDMSLEEAMERCECNLIKAAYEKHGSSRKVAAALGISQSKANRLIQRYVHA